MKPSLYRYVWAAALLWLPSLSFLHACRQEAPRFTLPTSTLYEPIPPRVKFDIWLAGHLNRILFPEDEVACQVPQYSVLLPASASIASIPVVNGVPSAIGYLNDPTTPSDVNAALVLHFMERRFDVRFSEKAKAIPAGLRFEPLVGLPAKRLPNDAFFVEKILHCTRNPLAEDTLAIFDRLQPTASLLATPVADTQPKPILDSTPVIVLATQWASEQGCISRQKADQLSARYAELIAPQLEITEQAGLAYIYNLAMLYYSGHGAIVQPHWIARVRKAQRDDGGWAQAPGGDISDPHATALALWVLLESEQTPRQVAWAHPRRGR